MNNSSIRILIVDEDRLLGEFYSCLLGLQGYTPVWVSSARQARQQVEQPKAYFSMAVIDLLPPGDAYWDFVTFLREREETASLPIITVTGITLSDEELQKLKLVSSTVLQKGNFELAKFKDAVANLAQASLYA